MKEITFAVPDNVYEDIIALKVRMGNETISETIAKSLKMMSTIYYYMGTETNTFTMRRRRKPDLDFDLRVWEKK